MPAITGVARLTDPVTAHLRRDFAALSDRQTVGQALDWLRAHPPQERVIYLYVTDADGRLCGVVPTRRLLLAAPDTPVADLMVRQVIALPADATVMDACEFFIQHRLLGFPVVDADRRVVGVVDVDLYTAELARLHEARPVRQWLRPVARFLRVESASGVLLLACTAVAVVMANSPWAAGWAELWHTSVRVGVGRLTLDLSLLHWINDGLMTLFFFVAGLEIKREIVDGELSDRRKAALPVLAALGGMVAPAVVYLAVLAGRPGSGGWGIPMATDIAFVVGFLALLGKRVPHGLKVFLLSLAIADDIGAVVVIAAVYSADVSLPALAAAAAGLGLVVALRWAGVRSVAVYATVGAVVWLGFLKSGVHPTVAGVALGLLTPARPWPGDRMPLDVVADLVARVQSLWEAPAAGRGGEAVSPLERLEQALHPWVAFGIMPLFALANAGVAVAPAALATPVAAAVALGLIVGKPAGVVLFSLAAVRARVAVLPAGVDRRVLVGAGCLAGIGFTMSLFIAGLALRGPLLDEAKLGILTGSTLSAAVGCLLLIRALRRPAPTRGVGHGAAVSPE